MMPPKNLMDKIDWTDPSNPKLKAKVSKEDQEKFLTFVNELHENGKVHKNKGDFEAEYY